MSRKKEELRKISLSLFRSLAYISLSSFALSHSRAIVHFPRLFSCLCLPPRLPCCCFLSRTYDFLVCLLHSRLLSLSDAHALSLCLHSCTLSRRFHCSSHLALSLRSPLLAVSPTPLIARCGSCAEGLRRGSAGGAGGTRCFGAVPCGSSDSRLRDTERGKRCGRGV